MRSLQRNWRDLYYANPVGTEPILDEYGNDTLEVKQLFGDPELLKVNVSANVGLDIVNTFGSITEYSRTVTYCGYSCPMREGSRVWFGADTAGAHNYLVVKVADSKNGYLIALREVSGRV